MPSATATDLRAAVQAVNREFMTAFGRRDAAAIAALYTSAGSVLPPGGPAAEGPVAVQHFWQGAFDLGLAEAVLETGELEAGDGLAYETGAYTLKTAGGEVADQGKYMVIWKRDGDRWMIHRDIWNTSVAPSQ